jgi:hypothetical protein
MKYTFSTLIEKYALSESNRSKHWGRIVDKFSDCIEKLENAGRGKHRKCEIWFKPNKYDTVNEYYARNKRFGETADDEYIYGFELLAYPGHYKFGKTRSWKHRRNSYFGHNSVGRVLFVQRVCDSGDVEKKMLQYVGKVMTQEDFGFEWFKTDKTFEEVSGVISDFVKELNSQ